MTGSKHKGQAPAPRPGNGCAHTYDLGGGGVGVEHQPDDLIVGQRLAGLTGHQQQCAPLLRLFAGQLRRLTQLVIADEAGSDQGVEIVTAQGHVTGGGLDLEHPAGEFEHRHVEGAAPQVVDGIDALLALVQPIGDGGGGGLVDQAQHVQAGQPGRVLRGLALGIVEVGGHRDDGTGQFLRAGSHAVERPVAQHLQDLGRDLDG